MYPLTYPSSRRSAKRSFERSTMRGLLQNPCLGARICLLKNVRQRISIFLLQNWNWVLRQLIIWLCRFMVMFGFDMVLHYQPISWLIETLKLKQTAFTIKEVVMRLLFKEKLSFDSPLSSRFLRRPVERDLPCVGNFLRGLLLCVENLLKVQLIIYRGPCERSFI